MAVKVTAYKGEKISFLNGDQAVEGLLFVDGRGGMYSPMFCRAMNHRKDSETRQEIWTFHHDGVFRSGAYTSRCLGYIVVPEDSLGEKEFKAPAGLIKAAEQS